MLIEDMDGSTMRIHLPQGTMVQLTPSHFVGQGGQGRVFAQPPWAYKVYHDEMQAMSVDKMKELSEIGHRQVLTPHDPITNDSGHLVGYSMPYVTSSVPLCRLYTRDYQARHGLDTDDIVRLVRQIVGLMNHIHDAGILVVDLNGLNILVSGDHTTVYFIDTDSYATPSFPPTALLDSVRDPLSGDDCFHEGSDWFSFAVVTFQLFTGVHPYRGQHPHLKTLKERMRAGVSVFDPQVIRPPSANQFEHIPHRLRAWYRDVFEKGHRQAPPEDFGYCEPVGASCLADTDTLVFQVTGSFDEPIRACSEAYGRSVVVTDTWIYVDGHCRGRSPGGQIEIVFSPRRGVPLIISWTQAEGLRVWDTQSLSTRAFGLRAEGLIGADGNAFILSDGRLLALDMLETPDGVHVGTRQVTTVHRLASDVYPGCVVQNLFETRYFTCVSSRGAIHRRIPELDGHRIIDAAYTDGALVILGLQDGCYDHFLIRFAGCGNHYRVVARTDIEPFEPQIIGLTSGIIVYQEGGHELCLVHGDPSSNTRRRVALDQVSSFRLWAKAYGLGFIRGHDVGTVQLKPTG